MHGGELVLFALDAERTPWEIRIDLLLRLSLLWLWKIRNTDRLNVFFRSLDNATKCKTLYRSEAGEKLLTLETFVSLFTIEKWIINK